MEDVSKLPKWARERLENNERLVERYLKELKTITEENSNIHWVDMLIPGVIHFIPNNAWIVFNNPKGLFQCRMTENGLDIYGINNCVKISATASNHFVLEGDE